MYVTTRVPGAEAQVGVDAGNRDGRGRLAGAERDADFPQVGPRHRAAPREDDETRARQGIQGSRLAAENRVRLRHVAHGL